MRVRRSVCAVAGVLVLLSTLLPWSATGTTAHDGWQSATLALAVTESVQQPAVRALAAAWFLVPLLAAASLALCASPLPWTSLAQRGCAVLVLLTGSAVLVALDRAGWSLSVLGPGTALLGVMALLLFAGPIPRAAARPHARERPPP